MTTLAPRVLLVDTELSDACHIRERDCATYLRSRHQQRDGEEIRRRTFNIDPDRILWLSESGERWSSRLLRTEPIDETGKLTHLTNA